MLFGFESQGAYVKQQWRVHLESGTTHLDCWVDKKVKVGDQVTLKNSDEPDRWWDVITIAEGWRNESDWKVGGLK